MAGEASRVNGRKGGRRKGVPNKSTVVAKEAIARFVDDNAPRLQAWLDQIAQTEGPRVAFNAVVDLLEFHIPKLARTEVTGKDGGAVELATTIVHEHPDR